MVARLLDPDFTSDFTTLVMWVVDDSTCFINYDLHPCQPIGIAGSLWSPPVGWLARHRGRKGPSSTLINGAPWIEGSA